MRARNIKPGFFKNEDLAEIEPIGRLLFAGLWCMADSEGRLEDRPKRVKIETLPYDNLSDQKVGALLSRLQELGFILRYCVSGCKYIQIVNFRKHQNPHIKEAASTIPAPEIPVQAPDEHGSSPADSLIPDSLIPDSLIPEPPTPPKGETDFLKFWIAYPKKVGKLDAQKAWKKNERPGIDKIIEAVEQQKASPQWTKEGGRFIPNPATWLNQGRWDDVPLKEIDEVEAWLQRKNSTQ